MGTITINGNGGILSGASYCFRSREAAVAHSRKTSTDPGAVAYYDLRTRRDVYLATGETSAATREQSVWGRGGKPVTVIAV